MGRVFSRRDLIRTAAVGAAAIAGAGNATGAGQSAPANATQPTYGDMALVNGRFVDGRGIVASSLVLKNGRIAGVGQTIPIAAGAPTIDLGGRTVIPGL